MFDKYFRLLILWTLPIAAYGIFREWLDSAPIDNNIRLIVLVYMFCFWASEYVKGDD